MANRDNQLVCCPPQSISDGFPLWGCGWHFGGDPVESARIQFVQGAVQDRGICVGISGHLQYLFSSTRIARDSQIHTATFTGDRIQVREDQLCARAVMLGMHTRRGVSAFWNGAGSSNWSDELFDLRPRDPA